MTVDSARITLYDTASTQPFYDSTGQFLGYKVAAGDAFFLLSAASNDIYDHYLATNFTELLISSSRGTWSISSFSIEYVDDNSYTWEVSVPMTSWD